MGVRRVTLMRWFMTIGLALLCFLGGVLPVQAYVPGSTQLVDQYLKALGRLETLGVQEKLVFFDPRIEEGSVEFDEQVKYLFPNKFRSDIVARTTTKTTVLALGKALVLIDGKLASEHEGGFDYYKDVLLFRDRQMLRARLERLGIDLHQTWLDRFDGRVVFVIGERGDEGRDAPGLYLDKKTFLPVRLVVKGAGAGESVDRFEMLFLDWRKFGKTKYPSRIEFYRNRTLEREIRVEKVLVEPEFDEALFDVTAIRAKAIEAARQSNLQPDGSKDGDVKKTIDGLDKIIDKDSLAF